MPVLYESVKRRVCATSGFSSLWHQLNLAQNYGSLQSMEEADLQISFSKQVFGTVIQIAKPSMGKGESVQKAVL